MREAIILECSECKGRNYMTTLDTRGGKKLELKKYCKKCCKHQPHKSRKT